MSRKKTKNASKKKKVVTKLTPEPPKTTSTNDHDEDAASPPDIVEQLATPTRASLYARGLRGIKHIARFCMHNSAPEIFLVTSLLLARYLQNSDFSYPSEIMLPIVIFAVIVTGVYWLYRWILRDVLGAHAAALALTYGLYGYTYTFPTLHTWAAKLVPHSLNTAFISSLITVLVLATVFGLGGLLVWLIARRIPLLAKAQTARQLTILLVFAISFIFVVQLGKVGLRLWTIRHQLSYHYTAPTLTQDTSKITGKPNVYYIVLDRYANSTTLKNDYNYDNSSFTDFLSGQGFTTRSDAYANYPFTMQSISSTLGMDYHTDFSKLFANDGGDFQTAFPYRAIFDNSAAAQAFKKAGYTYNQVSSWWDFTRDNIQADNQPTIAFRLRMLGMTFWLTDLQRDIVNKSILSPFLKKGITIGSTAIIKYDKDTDPRTNFEEQISALKTIATDSGTQKTPQFTFAHILVPHDPYIFNADGSNPDYDGDRDDGGVDETVKYTNQLTYLDTRVEDLVSTIRAKDQNAAVIIQSDEGPYPKDFRGTLTPTHYYNPITLPVDKMQQKFGVLASYYVPNGDGAKIDSSVNALRVILQDYLGFNTPQLPDCQFTSGDKYVLYTYQLVSGQLKGTSEPNECRQYQ